MKNFKRWGPLSALLLGLALVAPSKLAAHCDGLDGPVVKAAQTPVHGHVDEAK